MDLWEYTLMENGTYGLNDSDGLIGGVSGRSAGYIGGFNEDRTIIGTMPTYISTDNGKNYLPVTTLVQTFYSTKIKIAPKIPHTVKNMAVAFYECSNLSIASNIPSNVTNMAYTFSSCTALVSMPKIGNKVINFIDAFHGETSLKNISLKIPESVKNISGAFWYCNNLSGTIEINAQPTDYNNCFTNAAIAEGAQLKLTGTCSVLDELRAQGGNIT